MISICLIHICIECPPGWTTSIDRSCIISNGTTTSNADAAARCYSLFNSRIVETHDVAKYNFVNNYVQTQSGVGYYVNGYRTSASTFIWGSNYSPFNATGQWASGEPDSSAQECLEVCVTGPNCNDGPGMYDVFCFASFDLLVVCELPCNCLP